MLIFMPKPSMESAVTDATRKKEVMMARRLRETAMLCSERNDQVFRFYCRMLLVLSNCKCSAL